jgi:hypothetical protein
VRIGSLAVLSRVFSSGLVSKRTLGVNQRLVKLFTWAKLLNRRTCLARYDASQVDCGLDSHRSYSNHPVIHMTWGHGLSKHLVVDIPTWNEELDEHDTTSANNRERDEQNVWPRNREVMHVKSVSTRKINKISAVLYDHKKPNSLVTGLIRIKQESYLYNTFLKQYNPRKVETRTYSDQLTSTSSMVPTSSTP